MQYGISQQHCDLSYMDLPSKILLNRSEQQGKMCSTFLSNRNLRKIRLGNRTSWWWPPYMWTTGGTTDSHAPCTLECFKMILFQWSFVSNLECFSDAHLFLLLMFPYYYKFDFILYFFSGYSVLICSCTPARINQNGIVYDFYQSINQ